MRDLLILIVHLITTVIRLAKPGGLRAVVAEPVLAKHQLLILNRSRRRSRNLRIQDQLIAGFCSIWIKPSRLRKMALAFKTSTLLSFHRTRLLFWTVTDLELKLLSFRDYYNRYRTHSALEGQTPLKHPESKRAELKLYRWQTHCRGVHQTPIAA